MTDINSKTKRKFAAFVMGQPEDELRISSDKERYHNALDVGYLMAAWIGFFSTLYVLVVILDQKPIQVAFFFNAVITFLLFVGGVIGFYFHARKMMLKELIALPAVVIGLIFILVAYVFQTVHMIAADENVSVVTGVSGALITVFIIYLSARYRFILSVLREDKINKKLIEKIEAK